MIRAKILESLAVIVAVLWLGIDTANAARLIGDEEFLDSAPAQAFREERFADALTGFEALLERYPDDVLILRYIGLSHDRLDQNSEAIAVYERVLALAPDDVATTYFLGAVLFEIGAYERAGDVFHRVLMLAPESDYAARVDQYLAAIHQEQAQEPPAQMADDWSASLQVGLQYDDNVPSASGVTPGDTESWRIFERLRGAYRMIDRGTWRLTIDGDAYLSQHLDSALNDFDVGSYSAGLTGRYANRTEHFDYALSTRYGFNLTTLEGDVFSSTHSLRTTGVATWSLRLTSEVYHQISFADFRDSGFFAPVSSRDATLNVVGTKQYVFFDSRRHYVWAGYEYQHNDADGLNFTYRTHLVQGGVVLSLPWAMQFSATGSYADRDYYDFVGFGPRETDIATVSAVVAKDVVENLSLSLGYWYTDEDSTISLLDFDRQIATFSLIYSF